MRFFTWFDHQSWYPLGRPVATRPGVNFVLKRSGYGMVYWKCSVWRCLFLIIFSFGTVDHLFSTGVYSSSFSIYRISLDCIYIESTRTSSDAAAWLSHSRMGYAECLLIGWYQMWSQLLQQLYCTVVFFWILLKPCVKIVKQQRMKHTEASDQMTPVQSQASAAEDHLPWDADHCCGPLANHSPLGSLLGPQPGLLLHALLAPWKPLRLSAMLGGSPVKSLCWSQISII